MEFSNIEELKKRVMPALKIRVRELKSKGYNFSEDSLWDYFVGIWKKAHNLTLANLVDDILNYKIDI